MLTTFLQRVYVALRTAQPAIEMVVSDNSVSKMHNAELSGCQLELDLGPARARFRQHVTERLDPD